MCHAKSRRHKFIESAFQKDAIGMARWKKIYNCYLQKMRS
jgi:hypothetical protein